MERQSSPVYFTLSTRQHAAHKGYLSLQGISLSAFLAANFVTIPEYREKEKTGKKAIFHSVSCSLFQALPLSQCLMHAAMLRSRNPPPGEIDFTRSLPRLVTDMSSLKISSSLATDCFRAAPPVRTHSNTGNVYVCVCVVGEEWQE